MCLLSASAEPFSCDFEHGALCAGLVQEYDMDTFDWVILTGPTLSQNTGPLTGYGGDGFYAYIEASGPKVPGENAVLQIREQMPVQGNKLIISQRFT